MIRTAEDQPLRRLVSNLGEKKIVSKVLDKGSDNCIMIVSIQGNP